MNGDDDFVVYFDSSALAKLLLEDELGSDLAHEIWNRCTSPISNRLAHPEVSAALAAAVRSGRVRGSLANGLRSQWERIWPAIRPVELTEGISEAAGLLAGPQRLGGADAVHLASALELGSNVIFVTWDRRLHAAALATGLAVVPATLD